MGSAPGPETPTPLIASGGMVPHLHLQCGVCRWEKWESSEEKLERAYAAHLNGRRHLEAVLAVAEFERRIERYRLEDLQKELR